MRGLSRPDALADMPVASNQVAVDAEDQRDRMLRDRFLDRPRRDRHRDAKLRCGRNVDRIETHAHPGDRSQPRCGEHVPRQQLDAGQDRLDTAIRDQYRDIVGQRLSGGRIDDLETRAREDLGILTRSAVERMGSDENCAASRR